MSITNNLSHFIEFALPTFQNQRMSDRGTLPFSPLTRQGEAKKYNDQLLPFLLWFFFRKTIKIIFPQLLEQN